MLGNIIGGFQDLTGGMNGFLLGNGGGGGGRNTSPLDQISGIQALWDLDATLSASYSGSGQTWANIITSPDDGSSQSAYDFFRGASSSATTDDPTFNGTPNDAGAYWSVDGGDYFQIAGGNTTVLENLHKTTGGSSLTIIIALKSPASIAGTDHLYGTTGGNTGFNARVFSGGTGQLRQYRGGTASSTNWHGTISASTDTLFSIAVSYTGASYKDSSNSRTFTGVTLVKGTTTSATVGGPFQIGAASGASMLENGFRVYGCYGFNKILSDGELSSVYDVLNSRHARTYA